MTEIALAIYWLIAVTATSVCPIYSIESNISHQFPTLIAYLTISPKENECTKSIFAARTFSYRRKLRSPQGALHPRGFSICDPCAAYARQ